MCGWIDAGLARRRRLRLAASAVILTVAAQPAAAAAAPSEPDLTALAREFHRRLSPAFKDQPDADRGNPDGNAGVAGSRGSGPGRVADGTALLLTLRVDNLHFSESLLASVEGQGFRTSLDEFARVFDFPITADNAAGRAEGWFIREANRFALDLDAGTVSYRGTTRSLRPGEVVRQDGALMVGDWALAEWFGLELDINLAEQLVTVASADPLPAQERLRREERFARRAAVASFKPELPLLPFRPAMISAPVADVQAIAGVNHRDRRDTLFTGSYAAYARNDFLGGHLQYFLSGTDRDLLSDSRVSLSYLEPDGVAGIKAVTQLELGEVSGARTSLLSGRIDGAGLHLSNLPLGAQIRTDSTLIEGTALPGYDVELYRNDLLVGFQRVGEDGRYRFEDVELSAGANEFRIVLYGPQGQVEEEIRSVPVERATLAGLPLTYDLTVSGADDGPNKGDVNGAVALRYSLGRGVALLAGADTGHVAGARVNSGQLGLQYRDRAIQGEAIGAVDSEGRVYGEALANVRIGGASLRASHKVHSALDQPAAPLDPEEGLDDPLARQSELDQRSEVSITGGLPVGFLEVPNLRYALSAERSTGTPYDELVELAARIGFNVGRVGISSDLGWTSAEDEKLRTTFLGGTTSAYFSSGRLRARGRAGYRLSDGFAFQDLQASLAWAMSPDFRPELEVRHQFRNDLTRLQGRLNYDFGPAIVSPRVGYDSNGQVSAFVDLRFALGVQPYNHAPLLQGRPMSEDGLATMLVFLDEDGDGEFDPDEAGVPGAEIQAPQARRAAVTDGDGVATIRNLPAFTQSDIRLMESTLPPLHVAARPGNSLIARPGSVQVLEMPVVRVWSVEGAAWRGTAAGVAAPLVNATIVARRADTGEIVARAASGADGRYALRDLPSGAYWVELDPASLPRGLVPARPRPVLTDSRVEAYGGVDLLAGPRGLPAAYPALADGNPLIAAAFVPLGAKPAAGSEAPPRGRPVTVVRVGSYRSRLAMVLAWAELVRRLGPYLGGLRPVLTRAEENNILKSSTQNFPLRLGPVRAREQAETLCDYIRSGGTDCAVVQVLAD